MEDDCKRMGNERYMVCWHMLQRIWGFEGKRKFLEKTKGVRKTPASLQGMWSVGEETTTSSKGYQGAVASEESPSFCESKKAKGT